MVVVETEGWIIFVRDYEAANIDKRSNFLWAMEELQFLLYNILPYTILIATHWSNAAGAQRVALENEKAVLHHDISTE